MSHELMAAVTVTTQDTKNTRGGGKFKAPAVHFESPRERTERAKSRQLAQSVAKSMAKSARGLSRPKVALGNYDGDETSAAPPASEEEYEKRVLDGFAGAAETIGFTYEKKIPNQESEGVLPRAPAGLSNGPMMIANKSKGLKFSYSDPTLEEDLIAGRRTAVIESKRILNVQQSHPTSLLFYMPHIKAQPHEQRRGSGPDAKVCGSVSSSEMFAHRLNYSKPIVLMSREMDKHGAMFLARFGPYVANPKLIDKTHNEFAGEHRLELNTPIQFAYNHELNPDGSWRHPTPLEKDATGDQTTIKVEKSLIDEYKPKAQAIIASLQTFNPETHEMYIVPEAVSLATTHEYEKATFFNQPTAQRPYYHISLSGEIVVRLMSLVTGDE